MTYIVKKIETSSFGTTNQLGKTTSLNTVEQPVEDKYDVFAPVTIKDIATGEDVTTHRLFYSAITVSELQSIIDSINKL